MSSMITVGIDSSSRKNGIAIYRDGVLESTRAIEFDGKFTLLKLVNISAYFGELFVELMKEGWVFVIIEEPINIRNARSAMALNQVFGAIIATASFLGLESFSIHNKQAKHILNVTNKEEAVTLMRSKYPEKLKDVTDDVCDAVLMVESYMKAYMEDKDAN